MFCDYFLLVKLNEMGEGTFLLKCRNGFREKVENERYTAAGLHCRQNLKFENIALLFVILCETEIYSNARFTSSAREYFPSSNQC